MDEKKESEYSGLLSRAIQHEYDHLNGVFIIDKVSSLARMQVKKQLREIAKETNIGLKNRNSKNSYVL